MSTVTHPGPPDSGQHTQLTRFFRELRNAAASKPGPRTVAVWDKARSCYRQVDPANTADLLHTAARAIAGFEDHTVGRTKGTEAVSTRGGLAKIRHWLSTVLFSRTKAERHVAECYLAAARQHAAAGNHLAAQHAAQCCIAVSKAATW